MTEPIPSAAQQIVPSLSQPSTNFPKVEPGGSLIIAYQIRNKHVLVVGGGNVAAGRILHVLNADGKVTVVSPRAGLVPEVVYRIKQKQVHEYHDRAFLPSDLYEEDENGGAGRVKIDMVLTAIDDPKASTEIWQLCKRLKIPVNVADVPSECDFYFGSIYRDGPLQVMVSTNGNGPKLANIIRRQIASNLPPNIGRAITQVGILRKKLRKKAPKHEDGPKRMDWMSRVCELWSLEELCIMDEEAMDKLLEYYGKDREENEERVPTYKKLMGLTLNDERNDEAGDDAEVGKRGW